jgi:hypothetical protein
MFGIVVTEVTWRYLDAGNKCVGPCRDRAAIIGREKLVYNTGIFRAIRILVAVVSWEAGTDPTPRERSRYLMTG